MIELRAFRVAFAAFTLGPLDLTLAGGERVALVGPNGAGKSTTLRAMAGLLPGYEGSIRVDGEEVRDAGPSVRQRIGLLPERMVGFGWMTVAEHLTFLESFYPAWSRDRAEALVERLELPRRTKLANLSKGMQVKLSLVATESYAPDALLLDEPTSGLDPLVRDELVTLLQEAVPQGSARTLLFSSHILEDVEAVADRVVLLNDGRIVDDVSTAELATSAERGTVAQKVFRRLRAS
jgi:ABC-2 type transport system ATP-binding protein